MGRHRYCTLDRHTPGGERRGCGCAWVLGQTDGIHLGLHAGAKGLNLGSRLKLSGMSAEGGCVAGIKEIGTAQNSLSSRCLLAKLMVSGNTWGLQP